MVFCGRKDMKKQLIVWFIAMFCSVASLVTLAVDVPISLFPMQNYDQSLNHWLLTTAPDYNKPLLSSEYQQKRTNEFYKHLFDTTTADSQSPWSQVYVSTILQQQPSLQSVEGDIISYFDNQGKDAAHIGYGENFRPRTKMWIDHIRDNINLVQWNNLHYDSSNRAIALTNINARVLPTSDPHFYHFTLAGQGYPFDNLQMSSLWAGTPLYIVSVSKDKAWSYVLTPSFIAWVPSSSIARVSNDFVFLWSQTATQGMAVVTQTQTPINDKQHHFQFPAYVGSVFPWVSTHDNKLVILIPEHGDDGMAEAHEATVSDGSITKMPLQATRHNFTRVMSSLINRPYAWGGLNFYNDCSQELKSIYAAFGIWLPRHSSSQVTESKMNDESQLNTEQRIQYLLSHGHPMMNIIYIGGHVMMYVGEFNNPQADGKPMAMTYQNLWGLRPSNDDERVVVGESALLPLLIQYPENSNLISLASTKYFKIAYLDQWPTSLKSTESINIKHLVYPEIMQEGIAS